MIIVYSFVLCCCFSFRLNLSKSIRWSMCSGPLTKTIVSLLILTVRFSLLSSLFSLLFSLFCSFSFVVLFIVSLNLNHIFVWLNVNVQMFIYTFCRWRLLHFTNSFSFHLDPMLITP